MTGEEVIDAIVKLQADYFIPIHAPNMNSELFILAYEDDLAEISECLPIYVEHFTSYVFEP